MSNDRTSTRGDAATSEPSLTQKNSQTIIAEDALAGESGTAESNLDRETSTRTRSGAIPSSYGAAGGTTDAYEEGAGQADADAGQAGADGAGI
ncbi:MAG: hypothetical protein QOD51_814 [Candidatus Eremiobacteraeota bacterium]|nr:hypothetical protein [Candidatus Eremiobacteraeota bacterium]